MQSNRQTQQCGQSSIHTACTYHTFLFKSLCCSPSMQQLLPAVEETCAAVPTHRPRRQTTSSRAQSPPDVLLRVTQQQWHMRQRLHQSHQYQDPGGRVLKQHALRQRSRHGQLEHTTQDVQEQQLVVLVSNIPVGHSTAWHSKSSSNCWSAVCIPHAGTQLPQHKAQHGFC